MKTHRMEWNGLGFPVVLVDFPVMEIDGEILPDVNMKELQAQAFTSLITWDHRFTGRHVKYIRTYLRQTQTEFARNVNVETQSIVSQWEGKGDEMTSMDINTELVMRLHMASAVNSSSFRRQGVSDLQWEKLKRMLVGALDNIKPTRAAVEIVKAS